MKQGRGIASPYVEMEIAGIECDNQKYKTTPHGELPMTSDMFVALISWIVSALVYYLALLGFFSTCYLL